MKVDLLFDPFGARWSDIRAGAIAAEQAGFDGVWTYDHLAGSVHRESHVLECWTILSAIAAVTSRVAIGSMVLNVANRDAGTLAVMAATLQEVSDGRVLLGIGAGGGRDLPYAHEQYALGREVPEDRVRRANVEAAIATLRDVWTGTVGEVSGFLQPVPPPPIIVGGFGPKMAELAGRRADGINVPGGATGARLVDIAQEARRRAGNNVDDFVVTVSSAGSRRDLDHLQQSGVDRAVVLVRPPYVDAVDHLARQRAG